MKVILIYYACKKLFSCGKINRGGVWRHSAEISYSVHCATFVDVDGDIILLVSLRSCNAVARKQLVCVNS